jgi:hypothetical protein
MIIIYEQGDLKNGVIDRPMFHPPEWSDLQPDMRAGEANADTVYIARQDGRFQMVKARNAPLDPYPVRLVVLRAIQEEL